MLENLSKLNILVPDPEDGINLEIKTPGIGGLDSELILLISLGDNIPSF